MGGNSALGAQGAQFLSREVRDLDLLKTSDSSGGVLEISTPPPSRKGGWAEILNEDGWVHAQHLIGLPCVNDKAV